MRKATLTVRIASMAAPLAMALAIVTPFGAQAAGVMDTYWAAPPNKSAWVNPYKECWAGVDGQKDLEPCGVAPRAPLVLRLLFELDRYRLENIRNPEELRKLDDLVAQLKSTEKEEVLTVVGHTDKLGSWEHNVVLSENRAATIKQYMLDRGLSPSNVREVKGLSWEGGDDVGADGSIIDLGPLENNPMRRRVVVTEIGSDVGN